MAQVPLQQVLQLRQQGQPDNQIIQSLQGQGFASQDIFEALSQADVAALPSDTGSPIPGAPADAFPPQAPPQAMAAPPAPQQAMEQQDYMQQPAYPQQAYSAPVDERVEEIAETIINEKFEELAKDVQAVAQWKNSIENELQQLKDMVSHIKEDMKELRQGIVGKVHEYDENMRNVGANLEAVQNVFKEVIPEFTKNVGDLKRIAKDMKK